MDAPRIWIPRFKFIEPKRELTTHIGVRGELQLTKYNRTGNIVTGQTPWFPNLILNTGLDRLASTGLQSTTFVVGAGNATPQVTDTQLAALVASTTTTQNVSTTGNTAAPPYERTSTIVRRFATGEAAGNLAEVGIGWGTTDLFSRALILDAEGDPTTFPVGEDEVLDVTYKLVLYPFLTDIEDNVSIGGVATDVVFRPALLSSTGAGGWAMATTGSRLFYTGGFPAANTHTVWSGGIGPVDGSPSGSQGTADIFDIDPYTPGTFTLDYTVQWGLNSGNFEGGIPSCRTRLGTGPNPSASIQGSFSPAIDKDDTKVLTLVFRSSWTRL